MLIAAPGDALPSGGTLGSVSAFAANGAGDIAFFGSVFPEPLDSEGAVFLATSGTVRELARSGEAVQGMPGVVFEDVGNPSEDDPFDGPVINDAGVMAFVAEIENQDGSNERTAIFAAGRSGPLHLVATSGTEVLIAPGDPRTISEVDLANDVFPAGDGGVASSFNDANQLVFRAWFTDGSTAILLATVPEPGAAAWFALGGAALLVRRRR